MPKATSSTDASAVGKAPCTFADLAHYVDQLRDPRTAAEAVRALSKVKLSAEDGAAIRLDGGLPLLLQQINGMAGDDDLIAAMTVVEEMGWCDPPSRDAFVLQGVVRKLVPFVVHNNKDVVMSALESLEPYLWDGDLHLRNLEVFRSGTEEFFRCGGVARILRYLDATEPRKDICLAVSEILGHLGDRVYNRERLRDIGTISLMCNVVNMPVEPVMKQDWLMSSVSFLSNMARSDFTHTTMRECNVLEMAEEVIRTTTLESNKMFALMLVAHVYGNDDQNHRCLSLLDEHDVSRLVVQLLDTTKHGDGLYKDIPIPTEEATHAARSLSRERKNAGRLMKGGAVPLLLEIIQGPQTSKDTQAVYNCLLALANMSIYAELRKPLQDAGVVKVVTQLENSPDLRIADSAKTVLLNLSKLHDDAATKAHAALTGGADDFKHKYEVFLSHKRTDAKDFARALYNLFVLRGVSCFLDFEYREELGDLAAIVANSLNFIFVLTDNVFESKWCMKELQAAVESEVNIILIVKDGSRSVSYDVRYRCHYAAKQDAAKQFSIPYPPAH
ncbi:hypothetical protein Vretifemale_2947 [Volvox reticuliferus]|uniref:TIR domain-containing protein n=1 Tax=Volvox reticuliferus TaxID=1737510 RepID=A0A8J4C1G0_9CHLO|nr:hypothetical protein Vretifemale_2947 [Volvox reticuliferus]